MEKSKDLLIEIGTEEIPASFLEPAAQGFQANLEKFFKQKRIAIGKTKLFYTPRRIAVLIDKVASKQETELIEVTGPPWRSAFDQNGNPMRSAHAFAKSQGKTVHDLYPKKTDRGEYVYLKKETPQEHTTILLSKALPEIIQTIPFAKTMRWSETKLRFGRPLRWICALYGSNPITFKVDGISSLPNTLVHRNYSTQLIKVNNVASYEKTLLRYGVIPDPLKRKKEVKKKLKQLCKKIHCFIIKDQELLTEVVNSIEQPFPILGQFKPDFLSLPSVVLTTALKAHQHCFSIQNKLGNLRPFFITIVNNPFCNQDVVRTWYEKAIESRLKDALFFLKEDLKNGLAPLIEQQRNVIWIEELGSLYDKTQRLIELSKFIAQYVPLTENISLIRAAELAKVDLLTNMVKEKEFTSLQGVIGGIYAEASGETVEIVTAIQEHYLPKGGSDSLPKSKIGALISIIDKIDNIVASFIVGAIPTGSEDPFALRRQASAILSIIMEKKFLVDLAAIISHNLELYSKAGYEIVVRGNLSEVTVKIFQFIKERLTNLLHDQKLHYDTVNAILELYWKNPIDSWQRASALEKFRTSKDFEALVIGQKRVVNILKGQEITGPVKEHQLIEKEEKELLEKAKEIEKPLTELIKKQNYTDALLLLLSLRKKIDKFFDNVLVMTGDQNLRQNRLALLDYLKSLFMKVADLSQIVIAGE